MMINNDVENVVVVDKQSYMIGTKLMAKDIWRKYNAAISGSSAVGIAVKRKAVSNMK